MPEAAEEIAWQSLRRHACERKPPESYCSSTSSVLMPNEQKVQECDATEAEQNYYSWLHNSYHSSKWVGFVGKNSIDLVLDVNFIL